MRRSPLAPALQAFGLINGVAGRQALGALVGVQSGRALSLMSYCRGPAARLEAGLRARFGILGLTDPALAVTALCSRQVWRGICQ